MPSFHVPPEMFGSGHMPTAEKRAEWLSKSFAYLQVVLDFILSLEASAFRTNWSFVSTHVPGCYYIACLVGAIMKLWNSPFGVQYWLSPKQRKIYQSSLRIKKDIIASLTLIQPCFCKYTSFWKKVIFYKINKIFWRTSVLTEIWLNQNQRLQWCLLNSQRSLVYFSLFGR